MTQQRDANRAEATKARLLRAAVETFADKGFHGTTTRDIAARANLSSAALYVHHKSKEELLYQLSRDGHLETLQLIQEARTSADTPTEALHQMMYDFAAHHARGHIAARVVNYELAALAPEHATTIRQIRRQIEGEVRGLVRSGVASGDFDADDPEIAAAAILSLGIDLARWYTEGGRWTPEQVADRYAEMALRIAGAVRR